MPPKAENGAKSGSSNEVFLAACIKCAKERVVIDFEALGKETGMSKGGAANKFRAVMKQLEDDGAVWVRRGEANSDAAAKPNAQTKRKAPSKKTVKPATTTDEGEGDSSGDDASSAPKKRAKTTTAKKGTAKPVAKIEAKHEASTEGSDGEEEEDANEGDTAGNGHLIEQT